MSLSQAGSTWPHLLQLQHPAGPEPGLDSVPGTAHSAGGVGTISLHLCDFIALFHPYALCLSLVKLVTFSVNRSVFRRSSSSSSPPWMSPSPRVRAGSRGGPARSFCPSLLVADCAACPIQPGALAPVLRGLTTTMAGDHRAGISQATPCPPAAVTKR